MDGSQIYNVALGLGHNNDSGMAILTGLIQHQVKVIADGGDGAMCAVMPTNQSNRNWRAKHAALCSVIERVNSRRSPLQHRASTLASFEGHQSYNQLPSCAFTIWSNTVLRTLLSMPMGVAPRAGIGRTPASWTQTPTSATAATVVNFGKKIFSLLFLPHGRTAGANDIGRPSTFSVPVRKPVLCGSHFSSLSPGRRTFRFLNGKQSIYELPHFDIILCEVIKQ